MSETDPYPTRRMRLVVIGAMLHLSSVGGALSVFGDPQPTPDPAIIEQFQALGEQAKSMDWEKERTNITRAIDRIWERNGWTDDADRYAHDLARDISSIPPWKPLERLSLVESRLVDRYGLTPDQRTRFRGTLLRESFGVMMRNAGVIFQQGSEAIRNRANGEPFTPEQVARWAKQGEPLLEDIRKCVGRVIADTHPMLTPEKRRLLMADFESFEQRREVFDDLVEEWKEGRWKAEDWGMELDPIQSGAAHAGLDPRVERRSGVASPRANSSRIKFPKCVSYDPATWFACVAELEERFGLDPGQADAAQSVLVEVSQRAEHLLESHAERLEKVPVSSREQDEAFEPIRTLFAEMQERMNAIPTTAQRERIKP